MTLTNVEKERIFDKNQFGIDDSNSEVLSRTMWVFTHSALRTPSQTRNKADEIWRHCFEKKKKKEYLGMSTWSRQPRGSARLATTIKMSIKDLSVQKRAKKVTGNVQCLASKNLFTGDRKRPNHQKVLSSRLFVTDENRKIGEFNFLPALRRIRVCRQAVKWPIIPHVKHASRAFWIRV